MKIINKNILITLFIIIIFAFDSLLAQNISSFKVYFPTDSSNLSSYEKARLNEFIMSFDILEVSKLEILGYCDDLGHKEYNKLLSSKRANNVNDILIGLNINSSLITKVQGKGEISIENLSGNNIDTLRAFNRRVEIIISYAKLSGDKITINNDLKVGDKITLENILFKGGHHVLLPESIIVLDSLTVTLQKYKKYHFIILGHVCCVNPGGRDGIDLKTGIFNLSVARAMTIYDYLIKHGIDADRLSYKGLKGDYPTGRGDKYDRRVEIEVSNITN